MGWVRTLYLVEISATDLPFFKVIIVFCVEEE